MPPIGRAFAIEERLAIGSWATGRGIRLSLAIDRVVCGEEYEEVSALYDAVGGRRHAMLRRARDAVVVEMSAGTPCRFASVDATLAAVGEAVRH